MNASELQAGRELDALIAEKVMGLRREVRLCGSTESATIYSQNPWWQDGRQTLLDVHHHGGPRPYSTDIAAAWEVVEAMRAGLKADDGHAEPGYDFELTFEDGVWECWFPHWAFDAGHAHADTAPLAIVRAALTALEVPR